MVDICQEIVIEFMFIVLFCSFLLVYSGCCLLVVVVVVVGRSSRSGDPASIHSLFLSSTVVILSVSVYSVRSSIVFSILLYLPWLADNPLGSFCQRFISFPQSHGCRKVNHFPCHGPYFRSPYSEVQRASIVNPVCFFLLIEIVVPWTTHRTIDRTSPFSAANFSMNP